MHVKSSQSVFRDRTQEFQSIAEQRKKSFSSGSVPNGSSSSSKSEEQRSVVAIQSEFNRRASKIGYGIHQTSQKLAKLAKCKWWTESLTRRLIYVAYCLFLHTIWTRNSFLEYGWNFWNYFFNISIKLPDLKFTMKSDVKRCEGILLIG